MIIILSKELLIILNNAVSLPCEKISIQKELSEKQPKYLISAINPRKHDFDFQFFEIPPYCCLSSRGPSFSDPMVLENYAIQAYSF